MELVSFLPGALAAIPTMHYLTHPKKFKKRIPRLKYSKIEFSPNIKIKTGNHTLWLHHWVNFAIILAVSIPLTNVILDAHFTKGFLAGGILQVLLYKDRHKIFIRHNRKS